MASSVRRAPPFEGLRCPLDRHRHCK